MAEPGDTEVSRNWVARETKTGLRYRGAPTRREVLKENKAIQETAYVDSVTGLKNRKPFLEEANTYIAQVKRRNEQAAKEGRKKEIYGVAILDIDDFKTFNDTYGHEIGDKVLKIAAEAWAKSLRTSDITGRYGGDEMAAVLTDINDYDWSVVRSVSIQERVDKYIEDNLPAELREKGIEIHTSVGVGYSQQKQSFEDLMKEADEMMYALKQSNKRIRAKKALNKTEESIPNV